MSSGVDAVVARRIRRRRRLMGLTPQQLGAACGVSYEQMQAYENGVGGLSVTALWGLACALEVDIGYFFVDMPRALPAGETRWPGSAANAA